MEYVLLLNAEYSQIHTLIGWRVLVQNILLMNWNEVKNNTRHLNNCILVECIAEIKNNETGEIREYETTETLKIGEDYPSVFNWKENNYSCDCNKRLFFKRQTMKKQ